VVLTILAVAYRSEGPTSSTRTSMTVRFSPGPYGLARCPSTATSAGVRSSVTMVALRTPSQVLAEVHPDLVLLGLWPICMTSSATHGRRP
jgi:hypothetical protein